MDVQVTLRCTLLAMFIGSISGVKLTCLTKDDNRDLCGAAAGSYRANGRKLIGGWERHHVHNLEVDLQENVNYFVGYALTNCEVPQNDAVQLAQVYTQVVSGTNYCIFVQFNHNKQCAIRAYSPLPNANVEPEVTMQCQ